MNELEEHDREGVATQEAELVWVDATQLSPLL